MATFRSELEDGHIIAFINEHRFLLDTGSPSSFGVQDILITGTHFNINKEGMFGLNAKSLSELSGLKVDGLIGNDILAQYSMEFTKTTVTFHDLNASLVHEDMVVLPVVDHIMGVPLIQLNIDGKAGRFYFDTGAKLSYLSHQLLPKNAVGEREDFYPTLGKFTTKVYEKVVKWEALEEKLIFGTLPPLISAMIGPGNTSGIIGTELLDKYTLTLTKQALYLRNCKE